MSNISKVEQLREKIDETFLALRTTRRDLKKDNLNNIGRDYDNMKDSHIDQGLNHTLGLLGAFMKIGGSLAGEEIKTTLTNVADAFSAGSGVMTKFTDGGLSRLQGHLEELRDMLADDNKSEDEIRRLLQEIDQTLNAALEKAHRCYDSPFNPS